MRATRAEFVLTRSVLVGNARLCRFLELGNEPAFQG